MGKRTDNIVQLNNARIPHPPASLARAGRDLWRKVHAQYLIEDAGSLAILTQAASALDRATQCSGAIEKEGATITTEHGMREHPLLKFELQNRSLACRLLQKLGLHLEPTRSQSGRPPSFPGWSGTED